VPTPGSAIEPLNSQNAEVKAHPAVDESSEEEDSEGEGEEEEDEFEYRRKRQVSPRVQRMETELRQAVEQAPEGTGESYDGTLSRKTINCHDLKCTHIQCDIGELKKEEYVLVEIFSRLWVNTFIEEGQFSPSSVSSVALAQITGMPHGEMRFTPPPLIVAVTTQINPIDDTPKSIGWWWLLAILIALLILALVVYCCYKVSGGHLNGVVG
jgi:hypothetical protein